MLSDDVAPTSEPTLGDAIPEPVNPGWSDLCAQLIDEFPEVEARQVISEVGRARDATELFGLDDDERLAAAAAIARNNLALLAGGADLARLDPERHVRESRSPS